MAFCGSGPRIYCFGSVLVSRGSIAANGAATSRSQLQAINHCAVAPDVEMLLGTLVALIAIDNIS